MDSEMLENCHRKSGEGRNNHHKQKGHLQYQSNTDMPEIVIAIPCHHENGRGQKSSARSSTNGGHHSNGAMRNNDAHKIRKQHKEMTLQDMYNFQDTDDDEDSDWEPFENHASSENWFCTNCTMKNWDEFIHCDVCGEHKDSDILTNGSLAPSSTQEATQAQDRSKCKDAKTEKPCMKDCTIVGYDERMLLHSEVEMKDHPHPERPDRLNAILASLAAGGIFPGRCIPIPAREITREELQLVHTPEHVDAVEFTSCMISSYFTPDTYANEHSACAARLAAGLCADLATNIISGQAKNGFALVRPPGHHAGVKESMGFCLHNNAAVAALAAQGAGAKKVLIVDWDVHHGNGTQEIFDASKSVLYISLHRHEGGKFYPGTGAADEVGTAGAEGYCVNIPWECGGVGDRDYVFAFQHVVLPIALEFAPDLTIISAGFDAARGDPLGCCDVTPSGYGQMTQMLMSLSSGKLLVILEGGYNLRAISASATAVIKVLLGESPDCELNVAPTRPGLRTVLDVLEIQTEFWPNLESTQTTLQSQWASYLLQKKKCQPEPTTEIQQQGVHMTNLQIGEGIQATSRSPMSTKKDKGATGVLPDRMSSFPEKMPMVSEKISQQSLAGGQSEEDEQSFEDDKEDDIRSSVVEEGQKREMKERERMVEVKYKKRSDKEKEKRVKEKQNEQREKEGKERRVNEEKERENKRKRKDEEGEEEMRKEKKREDEKTGEQTERRVKETTREERKRKEKEERKRRKKSEEKRTDKEEEVREELDAIRMHKKEDTRKEVKFEKGKKVVEMKEKSFDYDKENAIGLSVIVEPHEREMKEMEGNVEVKYKKRSEKEREKRLKEKQNEKREKEENEQREKKREKEENEQREKEKREKKREKEENEQREKEKRERRGNEEKEMDKRKRTVEDGGGRRKEKEHKDKKKREETTREQERKIKGKEEKKRRKKSKEKRTDDEEKGKEVENDVSRCKEYDTLKEKKMEKVKKVVETRKEKDRKNMNGEKVTKRLDSDAPSFPRCKPLINQPTTVLDAPEGSCI